MDRGDFGGGGKNWAQRIRPWMLIASGALCIANLGLVLGDLYWQTYWYLYRDVLMCASNAVIWATWKVRIR